MIIIKVPLRISFFGGGTDYPAFFKKYGGSVLGTTIDKYCYITVSRFKSKLFEYNIRLSYRESECVSNVKDIKHRVFKTILEYCNISKDVEIHTVADLPAFTGLGSSSSFTVGLLNGLYAFQEKYISPIELAYKAIHIEQELLDDSVGCQDQTFAAVGGFNKIDFNDINNITVNKLNIPKDRLYELENNLIMVFTNIKRSASKLAEKQITKVDKNVDQLIEMKKMVDTGYELLLNPSKSLDNFGMLLNEAWERKKDLDKGISNPLINNLYEKGKSAGAIGGKLLGAGGGGFILFYVPSSKKERFKSAFNDYTLIEPKFSYSGSSCIYSQ